jgi:hypothetical protein
LGIEGVGVGCAKFGPTQRQRLFSQTDRIGRAVQAPVDVSQVIHALQRVRVVRAQVGLAQLQSLLAKSQRVRQATRALVNLDEYVHRLQCVGMVRAEHRALSRQRFLEQVNPLVVPS